VAVVREGEGIKLETWAWTIYRQATARRPRIRERKGMCPYRVDATCGVEVVIVEEVVEQLEVLQALVAEGQAVRGEGHEDLVVRGALQHRLAHHAHRALGRAVQGRKKGGR
jgi:hypothetical protein